MRRHNIQCKLTNKRSTDDITPENMKSQTTRVYKTTIIISSGIYCIETKLHLQR